MALKVVVLIVFHEGLFGVLVVLCHCYCFGIVLCFLVCCVPSNVSSPQPFFFVKFVSLVKLNVGFIAATAFQILLSFHIGRYSSSIYVFLEQMEML